MTAASSRNYSFASKGLIGLFLTTGLAALVPAQALAAPERVEVDDYWRVVDITGNARMLQGANPWNTPNALEIGDVVGPYQSVETNGNSSLVLARGEDVIIVYENTTIELPPPSADHAETHIEQLGGEAFYSVEPRPDPHFEVETPFLVAGVKGTEFGLIQDGARIEVMHGLVDATDRSSGVQDDVPAGAGIGSGVDNQPFQAAALDNAAVERWSSVSAALAERSEAISEAVAELGDDEASEAAESQGFGGNIGNDRGNN